MTYSSCVQYVWLPHSRPEHARQLPNGSVTVKPELRATHVARRKLRYQKSFVAASWLSNDKQSELHIAEPAPTQPQPVRRCKTACHRRASFVYVPVCLTICSIAQFGGSPEPNYCSSGSCCCNFTACSTWIYPKVTSRKGAKVAGAVSFQFRTDRAVCV